jgi:hypothetical protein
MRVNGLGEHNAAFITWVGSIPYDPLKRPTTTIPPYISQLATFTELVWKVYLLQLLLRAADDLDAFASVVILTTTNAVVKDVNHAVLTEFPGLSNLFLSRDKAD